MATDEEQKKLEQDLQDEARQGPSGGGFINLQRYMGVNQDQGASMADAMASSATTKASNAQRDLTTAKNTFNQKANAGALASPYAYAKGSYRAGGMGADLTSATAAQYAQRTYQGPKSLSEIDGDLGKRTREAAAEAKMLADSSGVGRAMAARNMYGKGKGYYSSGASALDGFLAGANGGESLNEVQKQFGGLEEAFGLETAGAAERAAALDESTKANAAAYGALVPELKAKEEAAAAAQAERDRMARYETMRKEQEDRQARINAASRKRTGRSSTMRAYSDEEYAATHGISYDEWLAAGKPGTKSEWETYWTRNAKG